MVKLHEEAFSGADPAPLPPDPLQIKVQPGDAIFGPGSGKDSEKSSRRKGPSFFGRLLRSTAWLVVIAGLCALAWAAGASYSSGHSPFDLARWTRAFDARQADHDELVSTMRQMAEDLRALKASIDAQNAARPALLDNNQPNSARTGAAITDLTARIDKLEAELTTKLSQVNEQLVSIEQHISASHSASALRTQSHAKRQEHPHDAFDPSQDPNAPGAPRPLGSH